MVQKKSGANRLLNPSNQRSNMPPELSSLDIKILVSELQSLMGARMQKFYQLGKELHILLHFPASLEKLAARHDVPQKGTHTLVVGAGKLFLTKNRFEYPPAPSNFAMTLRKYVGGKKITALEQHGFDRVVVIETGMHNIIAELFRNGNIVLTDADYKIWSVLEKQEWKDRTIKLRETYKFPARGAADVSSIKESDRQAVVFLASDLSFGGGYAEEILSRAKVEKSKSCKALSDKEISSISAEIKKILEQEPSPYLIRDASGTVVDFAPFPVERHKNMAKEMKGTFNEAVAEYFGGGGILRIPQAGKAEKSKAGKLQIRLSQQLSAIESMENEAERARKTGDLIYANYSFFESVLREKEKHEINKKEKTITVGLDGEKIAIFYDEPLAKSAEKYYVRAKQLKEKLGRLKLEIEKTRRIIESGEIGFREKRAAAEEPEKKAEKRHEWYSKFRWFFTSGAFLCVCGKDAETNEELIKKRIEKTDLVLHADITGSPFGLLKTKGKPAGEKSIKEALQFVASYSRAWQAGVGVVDAYWVLPEQVTKKAPAGEFISKGSFMIYGKKNSFKTELGLAIGIKNGELAAGAVSSVPEPFIVIKPGRIEAKKLAEEIKAHLVLASSKELKEKIEKIPINEIQRLIPFSKGSLGDI